MDCAYLHCPKDLEGKVRPLFSYTLKGCNLQTDCVCGTLPGVQASLVCAWSIVSMHGKHVFVFPGQVLIKIKLQLSSIKTNKIKKKLVSTTKGSGEESSTNLLLALSCD